MSRLASTAARGYAGVHQRTRKQWEPIIQEGQGWCMEVICIKPTRWIKPGEPWHLAHTPDRQSYRGPAHAACNIAEVNRRRSKAKRKRRALMAAMDWRTSRQW